MPENLHIAITDVVKGGICVAVDDGQAVYAQLSDALQRGNQVALSFKGVSRLTTAFLNAAVGQLYNEFDDEKIRQSLKVTDIDPVSADMVQRVIERAKRFFKDRENLTESTKKIMEDDRE
jgi:STAS-like domain of unknown function (DUF4325)